MSNLEYEQLKLDINNSDDGGHVLIKPNSSTNSFTQDYQSEPFYLEVYDPYFKSETFVSLTMNEAIEIRDYLDDKIKLMRGN